MVVHHVPSEIIREILLHLTAPLKVHEVHKFPWNICQVCTEWRALFLSIPPYKIEIEKGQRDFTRTMELLSFFLDITHGAPFSFTFYENELYEPWEARYVHPILSKIMDHSMQWENVSLTLTGEQLTLLHKIRNRLPLLHTLKIFPLRDFESISPDNVFEDTPLLTHIECSSQYFTTWKFNWASLTSIHVVSPSDCDFLPTLRRTVNLEKLVIDSNIASDVMMVDPQMASLELPRLEHLCINGIDLLTVLEAPALKVLKFSFRGLERLGEVEPSEDSHLASITINFLRRSKCKLCQFFSCFLRSPPLLKILPYIPDVQLLCLQVEFTKDIVHVIDWLGGLESNTPSELPLKHLRVLAIFSRYDSGEIKAVEKTVASRNDDSNAGLKELHVRISAPFSHHSYSVVDNLVSMCRHKQIRFTSGPWDTDQTWPLP